MVVFIDPAAGGRFIWTKFRGLYLHEQSKEISWIGYSASENIQNPGDGILAVALHPKAIETNHASFEQVRLYQVNLAELFGLIRSAQKHQSWLMAYILRIKALAPGVKVFASPQHHHIEWASNKEWGDLGRLQSHIRDIEAWLSTPRAQIAAPKMTSPAKLTPKVQVTTGENPSLYSF